jgi:hypothetical protein
LHQHYGDSFRAAERIEILDIEQTGCFYRYRNLGYRLEEMTDIEWEGRKLTVLKFPSMGGVCYFLDEIDFYFSARGYAENSKDKSLFWYFKQHRKVSDDLYLIIQHEGNVDKQLRTLGEDFTYLRNGMKSKMPGCFGLVRQRRGFTAQTYMEPYNSRSIKYGNKWFPLDPNGIASCYHTQAGVGIRGQTADVGKGLAKGMPPWLLVLVLVACFVGVAFLPGKLYKKMTQKAVAAVTNGPARPSQITQRFFGSALPLSVTPGPAIVETNEVFLNGYVFVPGKGFEIFLSDGRRYSSRDSVVQWIGDGQAVIAGRRYRQK